MKKEMNAKDKIVFNHFKTIATLNHEEREEILTEVKENNNWSLRQLAKNLDIPLTTVHGWITRRDKERKSLNNRSNKVIDIEVVEEENSVEKDLKDIGNINYLLRKALDSLKEIKEIDNSIGKKMFKEIKKEVKRINNILK
jgi:hypothetical protein